MRYEVILFDADDTLFDFKKSEREAFRNSMIEFNINYDEQIHLKVYHEINKKIWKEFEQGLITQEKLKAERFRRLSSCLNIAFDEHQFAKVYAMHLANASFLFEDSMELIEELHKCFKLLVVTNGLTDVQSKRIRNSDIAKFFQAVVISEEIKIAKPDAGIFEHAVEKIGYTDKSKMLMVGDSLTSDIQGGINYGIDTCWYNPGKIANNTPLHPTYEIQELMQLKEIIYS